MRRIAMVGAAVIAVAAIPAVAGAATNPPHGSGCGYTNSGPTGNTPIAGAGGVVVYDGTGMSGTPGTVAVGVCDDTGGTPIGPATFYGGSVEVGVNLSDGALAGVGGIPGAYAVVDGDDRNADPLGSGDGYAGVSNFESSGTTPPLVAPQVGASCPAGSGTNSGGCVGVKAIVTPVGTTPSVIAPVPLIVCGNTTGDDYDNAGRDGCEIP